MFRSVHSRIINAQYTEMFSCVQEPPLVASPPEVDWCGRLLGHTREETTVCIKGVPGDFVVDQSSGVHTETAKCQKAVTNLFDLDHVGNSCDNRSNAHDLPLADTALDEWRIFLSRETHPSLAEEMIKYFQSEACKLVNRNAEAALISYKICKCKKVEPETQKYIKCTVFTGVTEINAIPRQHQLSCRIS